MVGIIFLAGMQCRCHRLAIRVAPMFIIGRPTMKVGPTLKFLADHEGRPHIKILGRP
jgi:hypothetical protein